MATYSTLIKGAAQLHNQNGVDQPTAGKAATPFLSLLYLYHSHVPETARSFVGAGGLLSIAQLVDAPNLYIRGQALEVFQTITNTIDWFAEPDPADPLPTLSLHRQMLGLIQSPFLAHLLKNADLDVGPDSGALPFTALRIAAFWLSWVRFTFCKNGSMHLSGTILNQLEKYKAKQAASEEEAELATKVFSDFSSFEQAPSEGPWGSGITMQVECCTEAREKGNAAFKSGRCMFACMWYSIGIDLNPSDSACYANRAAALLKFSPNYEGKEFQSCLERVIRDCDTALELQPGYLKVFCRKAQALIGLELMKEADECISEALLLHPSEPSLEKLHAEVRTKMPELNKSNDAEDEGLDKDALLELE